MISLTPFIGLIQGSVLALGLWVFLRVLPRVTPGTRAWLWRLTVLKLACSAVAFGTITLHVLPGGEVTPRTRVEAITPPARVIGAAPAEHPPLSVSGVQEYPEIAFAQPSRPATPAQISRYLIVGAWSVGLVLFCLSPLFDAIRVRRWLRQVGPIAEGPSFARLRQLSDNAGLKRTPRLVVSESAPSPMVCGIWKPLIILPSRIAAAGGEDLRLALAHEIAHIRRRDLAWAISAWLTRSILFFNPAAWLAEKELRAAQESATDQEAVWLSGVTVSCYGEMLLRAMTPNRVSWNASGLSMFDSFKNAHRRLRAMKNFSDPPSPSRKVLGMTLLAIGAGCLPTYVLAPANAASFPAAHATNPNLHDDPGSITASVLTAPTPPRSNASASSHPTAVPPTRLVKALTDTGSAPPVLVMSVGPSELGANHLPPSASTAPPRRDQPANLEETDMVDGPQSDDLKEAAKSAKDEFSQREAKLIADQDARIDGYRQGADERELEAEEREREAQQRKREGEQRARAALLREQVAEEREKDGYVLAGQGQRETDRQQRAADKRQQEADQFQLRIDQKQRETDSWQREFDARSINAMREETREGIATARSEYQKRISELIAERREVMDEAAYMRHQTKVTAQAAHSGSGMHVVKTASGLSLAIPDGYEIAQVKAMGNGAYNVVLHRSKG